MWLLDPQEHIISLVGDHLMVALWRYAEKEKKWLTGRDWDKFRKYEPIIKEVNFMARKKATTGEKTNGTTGDIEWINVNITDDDLPGLDDWLELSVQQIVGYMCNIAERGFSFSLKRGKNDDYMCTIFGHVLDGDGKRYIGLSTFAASPDDAIIGSLWKFVVRLEYGGNIPKKVDTPTRRFR